MRMYITNVYIKPWLNLPRAFVNAAVFMPNNSYEYKYKFVFAITKL